jgi:uncharacterized protein YndB with AHSA1/START domain
MTTFPHRLDRSLLIHARPATVFQFLTDTPHWASWWGPGSTIDARPGGRVYIRHPNGIEVAGEVIEVEPPERIVFSYGYVGDASIPPGGSRVTIRLETHPAGTMLQLTHEFADARPRDQHEQGWRFQLSLFANAVATAASASAEGRIDAWFAAWSDPDPSSRERTLSEIAAPSVAFRDRFSSIAGADEVKAHLAAVHRFMPGMRIERRGGIRHCQWHVLADWVALGGDGQQRGQGTNLFVLDSDGRVAEVTGFWA